MQRAASEGGAVAAIVTALEHEWFAPGGAALLEAAPLELEVALIDAANPEAQLTALRALPAGAVAVVSGHSDTVPGLVEALSGTLRKPVDAQTGGPMLGHDEYDRLFVVTLPACEGAATKVVELRY